MALTTTSSLTKLKFVYSPFRSWTVMKAQGIQPPLQVRICEKYVKKGILFNDTYANNNTSIPLLLST